MDGLDGGKNDIKDILGDVERLEGGDVYIGGCRGDQRIQIGAGIKVEGHYLDVDDGGSKLL